jgi:hypothetical protein
VVFVMQLCGDVRCLVLTCLVAEARTVVVVPGKVAVASSIDE